MDGFPCGYVGTVLCASSPPPLALQYVGSYYSQMDHLLADITCGRIFLFACVSCIEMFV